MCLILFSYRQHAAYPLVVVANRDEFYARPTAPAAFWADAEGVLAGRDLQAGGTWMGASRSGRFAALTNYREPGAFRPDAPSRGAIVVDFLHGDSSAKAYLHRLTDAPDDYNGFNLLAGDREGLFHFSNREGQVHALGPGLYGLSNHLLDTPWPKVIRGKAKIGAALEATPLDPEVLRRLMADGTLAPDEALPDTGVGLKLERILSAMYITSPGYGTRLTTVMLVGAEGQVTYLEHTYPREGTPAHTVQHIFQIEEPQ